MEDMLEMTGDGGRCMVSEIPRLASFTNPGDKSTVVAYSQWRDTLPAGDAVKGAKK